MKKLYIVNIESSMIILAEDRDEAVEIGMKSLHEHLIDADSDFGRPRELRDENQIPYNWRDAFPFGEGGNKTCLEIMRGGQDVTEHTPPTFDSAGNCVLCDTSPTAIIRHCHLHAAAPDLLEALLSAERYIAATHGEDDEASPETAELLRDIQAALLKAKGGK